MKQDHRAKPEVSISFPSMYAIVRRPNASRVAVSYNGHVDTGPRKKVGPVERITSPRAAETKPARAIALAGFLRPVDHDAEVGPTLRGDRLDHGRRRRVQRSKLQVSISFPSIRAMVSRP